MTKVTMPPVSVIVENGYELRWIGPEPISKLVERTGASVGSVFITTDQAEDYSNARVLEVLKALEKIARDRHEIALSGRHNCDEGENPEVWEAVAVAMAHSYVTMETHIRALMPKEPPCET